MIFTVDNNVGASQALQGGRMAERPEQHSPSRIRVQSVELSTGGSPAEARKHLEGTVMRKIPDSAELAKVSRMAPAEARKLLEEAVRKISDSQLQNFRAGTILVFA